MSGRWIVVRTHPNCEKIAIRNLQNQYYTYYQPKILERKRINKQLKLVEQPLFPCYLFVHIINKWASLNSTHGIASVICMGSMPAIVSDNVIEDLKKREVDGIIQLPKAKTFTIGDKVTITNGPFAAQQGLVERMSTKERQQVLLSLLQNQIKILVDEDDLTIT